MDKKKIIGIVLIAVLSITAVVSGIMFARQYSDSRKSKEAFNGLADLVVDIDTAAQTEPAEDTGTDEDSETDKPAKLTEEEIRAQQTELAHEKYGALFEQNQDFIGWISIDGTNINYPVMQTPDILAITDRKDRRRKPCRIKSILTKIHISSIKLTFGKRLLLCHISV